MAQFEDKAALRHVGDNIRKRRLQLRMSQSQLAFEVGTTLRQIQRIERGDFNAGLTYYMRIAKSLNSSAFELIDTYFN